MSEKRYTSEEMREMEPFAVVVKMTKYGPVKETEKTNDLRAMLIQAADLEEESRRLIDDARAALVERDALKAQLAESDEKWASRVELQKRCTETVEKELNQANSRLSSVIKECERQTITGYQPKSELSQLVMRSENATFAKIKAIAKGEIK